MAYYFYNKCWDDKSDPTALCFLLSLVIQTIHSSIEITIALLSFSQKVHLHHQLFSHVLTWVPVYRQGLWVWLD